VAQFPDGRLIRSLIPIWKQVLHRLASTVAYTWRPQTRKKTLAEREGLWVHPESFAFLKLWVYLRRDALASEANHAQKSETKHAQRAWLGHRGRCATPDEDVPVDSQKTTLCEELDMAEPTRAGCAHVARRWSSRGHGNVKPEGVSIPSCADRKGATLEAPVIRALINRSDALRAQTWVIQEGTCNVSDERPAANVAAARGWVNSYAGCPEELNIERAQHRRASDGPCCVHRQIHEIGVRPNGSDLVESINVTPRRERIE
jgi:hypothetical protein